MTDATPPVEHRSETPSRRWHAQAPARGASKQERDPLELARRIVELAEDKKAADIVLLDLTALTTLADYFVICSGGSERQLDAIADGIVEGRCATRRPSRSAARGRRSRTGSCSTTGRSSSTSSRRPERDYYGLEKHWAEAKTILRVQ